MEREAAFEFTVVFGYLQLFKECPLVELLRGREKKWSAGISTKPHFPDFIKEEELDLEMDKNHDIKPCKVLLNKLRDNIKQEETERRTNRNFNLQPCVTLQCKQEVVIKQEVKEEEDSESSDSDSSDSDSNSVLMLQCEQEEDLIIYQEEIRVLQTSDALDYINGEPQEEVPHHATSITCGVASEQSFHQPSSDAGQTKVLGSQQDFRFGENAVQAASIVTSEGGWVSSSDSRLRNLENGKSCTEHTRCSSDVGSRNNKGGDTGIKDSNEPTEQLSSTSDACRVQSEQSVAKSYSCPKCSKRFGKRCHLKEHMFKTHRGEKLYKCSQCKEEFVRRRDLEYHVKIRHRSIYKEVCECGELFLSALQFSRHKRTCKGKNFDQCAKCEREIPKEIDLTRLMSVHDGGRPFCSGYVKILSSKALLSIHGRNPSSDDTVRILNGARQRHGSLESGDGVTESADLSSESEVDQEIDEGDIQECDQFYDGYPSTAHQARIEREETNENACSGTITGGSNPERDGKNMENPHFGSNVAGTDCKAKGAAQEDGKTKVGETEGEKCSGFQKSPLSKTNASVLDRKKSMANQSQENCLIVTGQEVDACSNTGNSNNCKEKDLVSSGVGETYVTERDENGECSEPNVALSLEPDSPQLTKDVPAAIKTRPHACSVCKKTFLKPCHLKEHMYIHNAVKRFQCQQCQKGFNRKRSLRLHVTREHGDIFNQVCECGERFRSEEELASHKRTHNKDYLAECLDCKMTFRQRDSFAYHLKMHIEKPCNYKEAFHLESSQAAHMKTHTKKNQYQCSQCKLLFVLKKDFLRHMKKHASLQLCNNLSERNPAKVLEGDSYNLDKSNRRSNVQNVSNCEQPAKLSRDDSEKNPSNASGKDSCDIITDLECNNTEQSECSTERDKLNSDVSKKTVKTAETEDENHNESSQFSSSKPASTHSEERTVKKPYMCPECGKRFRRSCHLKEHLVVHNKQRPFSCPECKKGFNRKRSVTLHLQKVHWEIFKHFCECGERFCSEEELASHRRTHNQEYSAECPVCKKTFSKKVFFDNHLKMHKEKPYKCCKCEEAFGFKRERAAHMKTHTKKKQYQCFLCKLLFVKKRDFRRHVKENKHLQLSNNPNEKNPANVLEQNLHDLNKSNQRINVQSGSYCEQTAKLSSDDSEKNTADTALKDSCDIIAEQGFNNSKHSECSAESAKLNSGVSQKTLKAAETEDEKHNESTQTSSSKPASTHSEERAVKKPFMCPKCGRKFKKNCHLKEHVVVHNKQRPFSCPECKKGFNRKRSLTLHLQRIHWEIFKHSCECGERFRTEEELAFHKRICHQKYPAECPDCKKIFINRVSFAYHLKMHDEKFKCEEAFAVNSEQEAHMETETHTKERPYQCLPYQIHTELPLSNNLNDRNPANAVEEQTNDVATDSNQRLRDVKSGLNCTETAKLSSDDYEKNPANASGKDSRDVIIADQGSINSEHSECSTEGAKLSSNVIKIASKAANTEAEKHNDSHQTSSFKPSTTHPEKQEAVKKLYSCSECGKRFRRRFYLKQHFMCVHEKQRPFSCPECKKGYSKKNYLMHHFQRVHSKIFNQVCPCGERFRSEEELVFHKRTHDQEYPAECPQCKKIYKNRISFANHLKMHNKKAYKYSECDNSFGFKIKQMAHMKQDMLRHVKTHTDLPVGNDQSERNATLFGEEDSCFLSESNQIKDNIQSGTAWEKTAKLSSDLSEGNPANVEERTYDVASDSHQRLSDVQSCAIPEETAMLISGLSGKNPATVEERPYDVTSDSNQRLSDVQSCANREETAKLSSDLSGKNPANVEEGTYDVASDSDQMRLSDVQSCANPEETAKLSSDLSGKNPANVEECTYDVAGGSNQRLSDVQSCANPEETAKLSSDLSGKNPANVEECTYDVTSDSNQRLSDVQSCANPEETAKLSSDLSGKNPANVVGEGMYVASDSNQRLCDVQSGLNCTETARLSSNVGERNPANASIKDSFDVTINDQGSVDSERSECSVESAKLNSAISQKTLKAAETEDEKHNESTQNSSSKPGSTHSEERAVKKSFMCPECGKRFKKSSHLKEHLVVHTKQRPFSCPECEKCFNRKRSVKLHLQRVHWEVLKHSCECGERFRSEEELAFHKSLHYQQYPAECPDCKKTFINRVSFAYHLKMHKEKPYQYSECYQAFDWKSKREAHMETRSKERPYHCSPCQVHTDLPLSNNLNEKNPANAVEEQTYDVATDSNQRLSDAQSGSNCTETAKLSSDDCEKNPANALGKDSGDVIIADQGSNRSEHSDCSTEGANLSSDVLKIAPQAANTEKHNESNQTSSFKPATTGPKKQEDAKKPYACSECGKRFVKKWHLNEHMIVHGKQTPFSCPVCKKRFRRKRGLKVHLQRFHGKILDHICGCGERYYSEEALTFHKRTHLQRYPVECPVCKKTFSNNLSFAVHLEMHLEMHIEHVQARASHMPKQREKLFQCTECEQQFGFKTELFNHLTVHVEEKLFWCSICNSKFSQESDLQMHIQIHRCKLYRCDECGKKFDTEAKFLDHATTHRNTGHYYCPKCGKGLSTSDRLKAHLELHRTDMTFECPKCKKQFQNRSAFHSHVKRHKEKILQCTLCTKRYRTSSDLSRHMKSHSGLRPFKCPECGSAYTERSDLNKHIRSHSRSYVHLCHICGKLFGSEYALMLHIRTHERDKFHTCPACGLDFRNKTFLFQHVKVCTEGKPFWCPQCQEGFVNKWEFNRHMKMHIHPNKNQCTICKQRFDGKAHLERHMRVHTGEKPFQCSQCHKRFVTKVDFELHKRKHAGIRLFECPICAKNFYTSTGLRRHLKKVHKEEKYCMCTKCGMRFSSQAKLSSHRKRDDNTFYQCSECEEKFSRMCDMNLHFKTHSSK